MSDEPVKPRLVLQQVRVLKYEGDIKPSPVTSLVRKTVPLKVRAFFGGFFGVKEPKPFEVVTLDYDGNQLKERKED